MWQEYINLAIKEINNSAIPGIDYSWITFPDQVEPVMDYWNEEVLGPINWEDLQERCERIERQITVPKSVTRAQALLALYNFDLLTQLESMIAEHPYPPVKIWFNNANEWYRDNVYVQALGPELGLTEQQIDDLFIQASQIL